MDEPAEPVTSFVPAKSSQFNIDSGKQRDARVLSDYPSGGVNRSRPPAGGWV
jgi:hypothetical protein